MGIVIPDVQIAHALTLGIKAIREEYAELLKNGHVSRSFLYILFKGLYLGKYDFFENAVELINTTPENPKHIDTVHLSYDHNANTAPYIFVTSPNEVPKNNSIGIGQEDNDLLFHNDTGQDERRVLYSRRYQSTYLVVVVSENKNEVTILFNIVKALCTAFMEHMAFEGLENMQIGGSDLRMPGLIPDRYYSKAVTLNIEYNQFVPDIDFDKIYRKIKLFWRPEGAEVAQGPIVIENNDDLGPSDDFDSET